MKTLIALVTFALLAATARAEFYLVDGVVKQGKPVAAVQVAAVPVTGTHVEYRYVCDGTSCKRVAVTVQDTVSVAAVPVAIGQPCSANCPCAATGVACTAACPCAATAAQSTAFLVPMTATPAVFATRPRPLLTWFKNRRFHLFGFASPY